MLSKFKLLLAVLCCAAWLSGCGGGNSTTTTIICHNPAGCSAGGPEIAYPFVQQVNNVPVAVDGGPVTFSLGQANLLYATVTLCVPGDASQCVTVDHLQVDTGSVGLRVLASKVQQLALPPVPDPANGNNRAWECYPFVIGGLWGPTVVADVGMGQQKATAVPVQLIQESNATAPVQVPLDCSNATNGTVLDSVAGLGSNGVLGIGSVTLDCGRLCIGGNYSGTYVQYYWCPVNATSSTQCSAAAVGANQQVLNPLVALPAKYSNGVVLVLPAVPGLGAGKVNGELIFGIGSETNNQVAVGASRIRLGADPANNMQSYLNITTRYNGQTIYNSYLDTGTNGLFFTDSAIPVCPSLLDWYCPASALSTSAVLSDGDTLLPQNPASVQFGVGDTSQLFATVNVAFGNLAGVTPGKSTTASFAWGLPFFYGRRVVLSVWDPFSADPVYSSAPWYSWSPYPY